MQLLSTVIVWISFVSFIRSLARSFVRSSFLFHYDSTVFAGCHVYRSMSVSKPHSIFSSFDDRFVTHFGNDSDEKTKAKMMKCRVVGFS